MQPLASQTTPSRLDQTVMKAAMPAIASAAGHVSGKAANDNADAWKPTLLVQRRRRINRRNGRVW